MADFNWKNPLGGMSKGQRIATVAGAAGIGGFMVYRHHKATGSWNPWSKGSSGSGSGAVNPVTGLPYSQDNATDPVTGMQYLAEAEQYGSVAAAEAAVSAYGLSTASGSGVPVNPASPPPSGSLNTPVGTNVYTSNDAWARAAQAGLVDVGYNSTDVAAALGSYINGQPLTPAQATIVRAAIAEYGAAPVGPLSIILAPVSQPAVNPPPPSNNPPPPDNNPPPPDNNPPPGNSSPPPGNGSPPPGNQKPPVPHSPAPPAAPVRIDISGVTSNSISCHWTNVPGASRYRVRVSYQSKIIQDFTAGTYSTVIHGLTPDHTYGIHVASVGAGGTSAEASTWAKTTR